MFMWRYLIATLLLITLLAPASAQFINNPPEQATYGFNFTDEGYDVEFVTNSSDVVMVGSYQWNASFESTFIARIVDGSVQWYRMWYSPYPHGGVATDVEVVMPNVGGLKLFAYVGTASKPFLPPQSDGVFVLYDEQGTFLCGFAIDLSGSRILELNGLEPATAGLQTMFYLVGNTENSSVFMRVSWSVTGGCSIDFTNVVYPPGGANNMVFTDIEAFDSNGSTFIVTGYIERSGVTNPIVAVFNQLGQPIQMVELIYPREAEFWDVEVNSSQHVILGGNTLDILNTNTLVAVLDPNLNPMCSVEVDNGLIERVRGVAQDDVGNIHFTGWIEAPGTPPTSIYGLVFPDCNWIGSYEYNNTFSKLRDVEVETLRIGGQVYTPSVVLTGWVISGFPAAFISIPASTTTPTPNVTIHSLSYNSTPTSTSLGTSATHILQVNNPLNSDALLIRFTSSQPVIPEFIGPLILIAAAAATISLKRFFRRHPIFLHSR